MTNFEKMNKLACWSVISFLILAVIISEISAQNPLNVRKRGSHNKNGLNQRANNADNSNDNGLPPENLIQRKSGQRRNRNRGNGQRQSLRLLSDSSHPLQRSIVEPGSGGMFPKPFNTVLKAKITANATCGENAVEEFCKMADIYSPKQQSQCGSCDANDPSLRHPITNAIDGTHSWWQSPSIAQGKKYEYVTIDIDLGQVYEIFSFKIKSAESATPTAWILEKSQDGKQFEAWQYFGVDEEDCMSRYNLSGQNANYIFKNDKEVICSTEFSETARVKYGEAKVMLWNKIDRNNTPQLTDQATLVQHIRLKLQGIQQNDLITIDKPVKWIPNEQEWATRSYYSLQSIIILGRCFCSGHAAKCRETNEEENDNLPQCECLHNTCGKNCNQCCPMYNQRIFRPGNENRENRCEKCQCHGHASECRYSQEVEKRSLSMNIRGKMMGGGVCLNCTKFTTGMNCEKCLPNYYRPFDRPPDAETPCVPCECNADSSIGCDPFGGDCICKENFAGPRCNECAAGFRGDNCTKCLCDVRGTMTGGECESNCQCKLHVEGEKCDQCVSGYFSLNSDNPEGCLKCFCSGVSTSCASSKVERMFVETLEGWTVTDIAKTQTAYPTRDNETGNMVFGSYELEDIEATYWSAPELYLGNRLDSYGSHFIFKMDWVIVRGDTSGKPTSGPNFILIGKNGLKIAFGDGTFKNSNASVDILLSEEGWYHVPRSVRDIITRLRRTEYRGDPVTRIQFMSVISDIDSILLRGTYHTDQAEGILKRATLYTGDIDNSNEIIEENEAEFNYVEKCFCPPGYSGLSCESCTFGYVRVYDNSTSHEKITKCIPCSCNGHAKTCDLESGECGECSHDTFGERCERCKAGFYGNAMIGTPTDCQKCACPMIQESNNFSPSCKLKELSLETFNGIYYTNSSSADYICTNCADGHIGDHCETCDDGYYGQPDVFGSKCTPCACNGEPCDSITGRCITCIGNTEGWRCERCKTGYYGDPSAGCDMCECSDSGAINNLCNSRTGKCNCKPGYKGQLCDECASGFADISLDCAPCQCHENGSNSDVCDPISGQCLCKSNVNGLKCDMCDELYFGLSELGCEGCNCHISGSENRVCDARTGQCKCRPNVVGRSCDRCEHKYWNIDSKVGCIECQCNVNGSEDQGCDNHSGQCFCKAGVEGLNCDRCQAGYYGFSAKGCKRCNVCDSSSKICDQNSGRCICPPLSHGTECQLCYPNTWGWQYLKGCQNCDCNTIGSEKQTCDLLTGQCLCKEGYTGRTCDYCALGHYNYPTCQKCNCDVRGSKILSTDEVIDCDDKGQCPCKTLSTGLKCDECRQSTFGLSQHNPNGCTRCFCFGRSQECSQNEMTWGQLRLMGARNVTIDYITDYRSNRNDLEYIVVTHIKQNRIYRESAEMKTFNGLNIIPSVSGNVTIGSQSAFYYPLYFQLPKKFLGDRINSYGGSLNFSIITQGCSSNLRDNILRQFPLIQIHTHQQLILDYHEHEILDSSVLVHPYHVVMHESYFRLHFNGLNISRAIMMTALQNIKHIFVRGTTSPDFTQVVLVNVTMDSGMPVNGNNNAAIALGVELCECPEKYVGDSCQDPADGYYRWRNDTDTSSLEELVGRVVPCECNDRSDFCDKETGQCLNCADNTGGKNCETCAEGYFGHPDTKCEACPCPETNKNFARGCFIKKSSVSCYCKEGYTGALCDRCAGGFFGYPQLPNGHCEQCDCHEEGIVSDECDELTGQCNCKPGVIGRRCDKCELPRHLLMDQKCQLCDNCTQTLMDKVDEMMFQFEINMQDVSLHNLKAPWIKLYAYTNETDVLDREFDKFFQASDQIDNFNDASVDKLITNAANLQAKSTKMTKKAEKKVHVADKMKIEVDSILMDIRDVSLNIQETIVNLNNYGSNDHHVKLPVALKEAQRYLDDIKNRARNLPNNEDSIDCANKQFEFWVDEYKSSNQAQSDFDHLKGSLKMMTDRLDDMKNLTHKVFRDSMETEVLMSRNREKLDKLVEKVDKIDETHDEVKKILHTEIISQTDSMMESIHDNIAKLKVENDDLIALNEDLNTTIIECDEGLKEAKTLWLPKARAHADDLMKRSKVIVDSFQHSKDGAKIALLASSAHSNISSAINSAQEAAKGAFEAARTSYDELNPIGEHTIFDKGLDSLHESEDIQKDALHEISKIDDLQDKLSYQEKLVKDTDNTVRTSGLKNNEMSAKITALTNSESRKSIQESKKLADDVSKEMSAVKQEAIDINSDVYELKRKLAGLEPEWDSKLGLAEENISKSMSNIRAANNTLITVESLMKQQNEKFQVWNASFSTKMQDLRDKIARAKHAAEGIRISVESTDSKCIRSYFPTTFGPSTSNSISMSIALSSKNVNSQLLYIQGEDRKFIALEMIKKKIYLIWNMGDDTGIISHPMEIQTRDPKYDDAWYRIEANRTLNIGTLIVRRMNNNGALGSSNVVTGSTSPDYTQITFDHTNRVYVGGVPEQMKPSELKSTNGLGVIVHQLAVDHSQVGLWHFASSEGECDGAMLGATETSATSNDHHFNGQGYAVVKSTSSRVYSKKHFSIQITFKTLDENALLFLTVDEKNNRSVSLSLYEGRIVFRIDYNGESQLEINTTKRFNTGSWVNVQAARAFERNTENGILEVNGQKQSGSPTKPITSVSLPDLSEAVYYLGGVQPGFKSGITKAPGADHAFLGCMKDVQINAESYNPMDSKKYFGVEPSCKEIINSAGFYGNGYVELPSHSLRKRANIGFVFRTLQPDCLIMLSAYPPQTTSEFDAKDVRGNFSVSLVNGKIHLWIDNGKGRLKLESNLTLNDGEYHVININKLGRKIELRINDGLQTTKTLSGTPALVNSPEGLGGLFLGGIPDFPEFDDLAPTVVGLEGAIKSIVFNNRTISYDQAMSFKNVHMGGSGPPMGGMMMPMKTEPIGMKFKETKEGCQRVGSYSYEPNAFKFGDGPYSHSVVSLPRKLWQRNFNIQFDFRTFYPDGLLFASAGSKDKPKHYVLLVLRNGQLSFIIRGRRREELSLPVKLNDGHWHHVTINCVDRKATLSVILGGNGHSQNQAQMKLPKKLNTMNMLFAGGLPQNTVTLPKDVISKTEVFKGCMRRFVVNTVTQDLAKKYNNVGQCFPRVEKGSYFPGDAFAEYKKNFNVGKYLEIELEFRTSELNGILISVAEPIGSPALSLEVHNGKVVMSCDLGDNQLFRAETQFISKFSLCDNQWHNISALYETSQIVIRIDNQPSIIQFAPNRSIGKVQTKSSLYIGGLPDSASSGTLLMRENFKGCIRNVKIRDDMRDWTDMDSLTNVLLSECLSVTK